jgi:ACT domain-containing protein
MIYSELLKSIIQIDQEYESRHGESVKVVSPVKRGGAVPIYRERNFCKSRRKIKLSRLPVPIAIGMSRAEKNLQMSEK